MPTSLVQVGFTSLNLAAQERNLGVARALFEHGADADPVNSQGNIPLFGAVFNSRGEVN